MVVVVVVVVIIVVITENNTKNLTKYIVYVLGVAGAPPSIRSLLNMAIWHSLVTG